MSMIEVANENRRLRALDAAATASKARAHAAVDQVRRRAREARARVQDHTRAAIDRRREAAATRLEGLVDVLRPDDVARVTRARRKTAAVVGISGVALVAAVGLGVALGYMLNRRLKARAELRERVASAETPAHLAGQEANPTPAAALDF